MDTRSTPAYTGKRPEIEPVLEVLKEHPRVYGEK